MEDLNYDELVLSSSRVVLEFNNKGGVEFYKTMRDIVERMYRRTFQLQYKNQSNDYNNKVICKLQEAFQE